MGAGTTAGDRSRTSDPDRDRDRDRVDGRRARGVRNRDAVVVAILDLLREGNLQPGAHDIAERSGVSVRSVFRHFDDLDSLLATAIEQVIDQSAHLYAPPPPTGPRADRIRAIVAQRSRLFEAITPTRIVAERLRARSEAVGVQLDRAHHHLREQLNDQFADELRSRPPAARRRTLEALDLALSWSSWHQLRAEQGLTVRRSEAVLGDLVERLVAPPA